MQLKVYNSSIRTIGNFFKPFVPMKTIILLTIIVSFLIGNQCYSQTITLSIKNVSIEKAFKEKYIHSTKPSYYNPSSPERLHEGNNGLGLKLMELSGDEVLPKEVYEKIKAH